MHIAVCDDNVADRHQMERLLKRESDQRREVSEPLYIDSFGNCASLLTNPMQYDVFYIDMCKTEGITGMDVVAKLTSAGVNAPIVMCCSDVNYREQDFPENVLYLDKPIKTDDLHRSLDHAQQLAQNVESLIELRDDTETLYLSEADILYAVEKGISTIVTLADGRTLSINSTASNFFSQVEHFPAFLDATRKTVINCRHIRELNKHKATMIDGAVFKIDRQVLPYAQKMFNEHTS